LGVLTVHIPALAARALAPGLFPLRLQLYDPLTQIPADVMVFHVLVPLVTLEHERMRAWLRRGLRGWLGLVGRPLGLVEYLLLAAEGEGELEAQQQRQQQQQLRRRAAPPAEVVAVAGEQPGAAGGGEAQVGESVAAADEAAATAESHRQLAEAAGPSTATVAAADGAGSSSAVVAVSDSLQQSQQQQQPKKQPKRLPWRPWRRRTKAVQQQEQQQQQNEGASDAPAMQEDQPAEVADASEGAPLLQQQRLDEEEQQRRQEAEQPEQLQPQPQPQEPEGINQPQTQTPPTPPPTVEWFQQQPTFPLKLVGLGAIWAATVITMHCAALVLPIAAGRGLFAAAGLVVKNDLFAGTIGALTLWGAATLAVSAARATSLRGVRTAAAAAARWVLLAAKVAVLVVLWLGVVATLLGVLFELILLPLRLPPNQTALLFLYQDWTLGVLALKLWHMFAVVRARDPRNNRPPVGANAAAAGGNAAAVAAGGNAAPVEDDSWHVHFEALQAQGLRDLDFSRALRRVVLPVLSGLLTALAAPFVLTRGVLPLLGLPAAALQLCNLYGYAACHGAYVAFLASSRLRAALHDLHNVIRDDRYLLGRRLNNFAAHGPQQPSGGGGGGGGLVAAAAADGAEAAGAEAAVGAGEGGEAVVAVPPAVQPPAEWQPPADFAAIQWPRR